MTNTKYCIIIWVIFLSLESYCQIKPHSVYLGAKLGVAFHDELKTQSIDGGGKDAIWQQIIIDQQLFNELRLAVGGEPIFLEGPTNLSATPSVYYGFNGGYFLGSHIALGLGYNKTLYSVFGNYSLSYEGQSSLETVEGTIKTNVISSYASINSTLFFGNIWQPFILAGIGFNWQNVENSVLNFSDLTFQTNSNSNSKQLTYQFGLGLSRNFKEKHQLNLVFDAFIYESPYVNSVTQFDPSISLSYRYAFRGKKDKKKKGYNLFNSLNKSPSIDLCGYYQSQHIDTILKELNKIEEEMREAAKGIEKNGLMEEVKGLRALIRALKALDQMGDAGTDALKALEDFTKCNNEKLKKQFKKSEEARNGVITSLKFLSTFLKIYADANEKNRKLIKKITDKIDKNIEKVEKALKQNEIDKALDIILAIKTEITWPIDVLEIILEDLWQKLNEAYDDAAKTAAKKALEAALKKALGASAGAAGSIAQDFVNLADLLWKIYDYDDLIERRNKKLIELIKALKEADLTYGSGKQKSCFTWGSDKAIKSIIFSIELICWCPEEEGSLSEGKWVMTELEFDPHDSGNKKTLTLKEKMNKNKKKGKVDIEIHIPDKGELPCDAEFCYFRVVGHIVYENGTIGTMTGRGRALK
jgi:hypothetical protein